MYWGILHIGDTGRENLKGFWGIEKDKKIRGLEERGRVVEMKTNEEKIKVMRENAKDILVASFYKETQVGRSIGSSNKQGKEIRPKEFKRELLNSIKRLRNLVDNETIKNLDIRGEIEKLSEKTGVSIGQAQKVINVYLKFYCLFLGKSIDIIKELDCPLDSTTMNKEQKMKDILTMRNYTDWQDKFEKEFGIKLLRDCEYDSNRMGLSFED